MTVKDDSLQQKIDTIINELKTALAEKSKDTTKITNLYNALRSIGTWHVIEPLKDLLEIPKINFRDQQKILELLGRIQDPRVVSVLASFLDNPDKRLRNTAIKSLSLINHPKVSQYLIQALKDDDKWVKIFAVHGLTKNASPKVVPPLIHLLGDSEEEVRKEAINALRTLKTDNIDELLMQALSSENRFIQLAVVNLLGERNVVASTEALVKLIGSQDIRLNIVICSTLGKLSETNTLIPLLDQSIQEEELNNRYLMCIQKMDKKILPSLIEIYLHDGINTYSESIEYLLSKFGFIVHELLLDLKSKEDIPDRIEKLDFLIKKLENQL